MTPCSEMVDGGSVERIMTQIGTPMTAPLSGRQRMRLAMSGRRADRAATMPQICHPHAIRVLCHDYRKGLAETIERPERQYELILEIARHYAVDGLRLFALADPMRVCDDGKEMIVLDVATDRRVGRVDLLGGGHVIRDVPETVVETLDDVIRIPRTRHEELLKRETFGHLQAATSEAHKLGFFVAGAPSGFTVNILAEYRGRQRALMDLAVNPDLACRIMDVALGNAIEHATALVECGVDALYIGDPLSSSSVISPRHFEKFCFERFRDFCRELHKLDVLIYIHICGDSRPILEMMAETGADCVEPLDPLGGVDLADAKRRIGGRVALMGGVNTLTLFSGSPKQVYEQSAACCRAAGSNGGYVLAAGDMVPDQTPEENVRAMVQAARDFRYGS